MKRLLPVLALALVSFAQMPEASAQNRAASGPQRLGSFGSWTAATHQESGGKVCYAFTRAAKSEGGGSRQNVMLTVTQRPQGRDQVAASLGYAFRRENNRDAEITGAVGSNELRFYGVQNNAFAQEGSAAVAAFKAGRDLVIKGPGPQGKGATTDTFSLSGFSAAYEAISKECPPRR